MCAHYLGMLGLIADIIGVLIIAYEWRRTFGHDVARRQNELQNAYDGIDDDALMAKEFSKLHWTESLRRRRLFIAGTLLLVFGFALQFAGTWPRAYTLLGLQNCS